jgi:hypothetical protein
MKSPLERELRERETVGVQGLWGEVGRGVQAGATLLYSPRPEVAGLGRGERGQRVCICSCLFRDPGPDLALGCLVGGGCLGAGLVLELARALALALLLQFYRTTLQATLPDATTLLETRTKEYRSRASRRVANSGAQ